MVFHCMAEDVVPLVVGSHRANEGVVVKAPHTIQRLVGDDRLKADQDVSKQRIER